MRVTDCETVVYDEDAKRFSRGRVRMWIIWMLDGGPPREYWPVDTTPTSTPSVAQ